MALPRGGSEWRAVTGGSESRGNLGSIYIVIIKNPSGGHFFVTEIDTLRHYIYIVIINNPTRHEKSVKNITDENFGTKSSAKGKNSTDVISEFNLWSLFRLKQTDTPSLLQIYHHDDHHHPSPTPPHHHYIFWHLGFSLKIAITIGLVFGRPNIFWDSDLKFCWAKGGWAIDDSH